MSRTVMASEGQPSTSLFRADSNGVDGRDKPGHDDWEASYGQIFFGFWPMPNDFGSAEVNSSTEGLNCEHSP